MSVPRCGSLNTCLWHGVGHTRVHRAGKPHLTWVCWAPLSPVRHPSPGGDFRLHQPEFLKGFTNCLYRALLETNGILKCFSFCRFRNLI